MPSESQLKHWEFSGENRPHINEICCHCDPIMFILTPTRVVLAINARPVDEFKEVRKTKRKHKSCSFTNNEEAKLVGQSPWNVSRHEVSNIVNSAISNGQEVSGLRVPLPFLTTLAAVKWINKTFDSFVAMQTKPELTNLLAELQCLIRVLLHL